MSIKTILIKRGLKSDLPALLEGEMGFCTDTYELYIGTNNGNVLLSDSAESTVIEYGARKIVGQSSPTLERVKIVNGQKFIGNDTGLVANVALGDQAVTNSFDFIPIFNRERVLINNNVLVKIKKYYIAEYTTLEDGISYHYYLMSDRKLAGYRLPEAFKNEDGSEKPYAYIGAYEAYVDVNGVARSIPNVFPTVNITRNNARIATRKNDGDGTNTNSNWFLRDLKQKDLIDIPFYIEFATLNSQSIFSGVNNLPYSNSHVLLIGETGTNRAVVSNSVATNFVVGQTVVIGTANSNASIADNRILLEKIIDSPAAGQTSLVFDGVAVNTAVDNVISSRAWKTGSTDIIKLASSGTIVANNGKYPFVWRGLENIYGNIWEFADGGKILDYKLWVAEKISDYDDVASAGGAYSSKFKPVSYNLTTINGYIKEVGNDELFPYASLPIDANGNSTTYYCDYVYVAAGDRTIYTGGFFNSGAPAGLSDVSLDDSLSLSSLVLGFRLSYLEP